MRTSFITLILLFLISTSVCGQFSARDGFEKDLRALQFGVNSNLNPDRYNGGLVSYRKFLTADRARYVGLSFTGNQTRSASRMRRDEGFSDGIGRDTSDQRIETGAGSWNLLVNSGRTRFLPTKTEMRPFVSAGWAAGGSYIPQRTTSDVNNLSNQTARADFSSRNTFRSLTLTGGTELRAGIEWFAGRNLSFLAEYGFGLYADWTFTSERQRQVRQINSNGDLERDRDDRNQQVLRLRSGQQGVRFALSAYF